MSHSAFNFDGGWFKQLFDSSPDPVWIIDGNRFVECNEVAISTIGYTSRAEFLNAHPSKLSPPRQPDGEDSFAKAERMMAIAKDKGLHRFEWMHTKADGAEFIAEVTLSAVQLVDRQVIYCVWRDVSEPKQAEAKLAESEERWKFALEGAGDGVWDWNIQTGEALYSSRWKEMLGFTASEIGNTSAEWTNRVHPDDMPDTMAAIQAHIDGRTASAVAEFRIRCKDGSWRWVLGRGMVVSRTPDGRALRLVGTNTDITERKQAQDALRDSEAFLSAILDSVFDQIAVIGHDGTIIRVNEHWRSFALENGVEAGKPAPHTDVGTNYLEVCQVGFGNLPDSGKNARDGIQAVLDGRLPIFSMEYPCHSPDQQRWFKMRATPLNRGRRGAVIAHTNITDIKQAEQALRDSEERLSLVLRGTQDGFWDWDLERDEIYYSPRWWHMLGYSEGELPADSALWRSLMHADDQERATQVLGAALANGTNSYDVEFRLLHKDGHYLNLISRAFILRDEKGKAIRISGANMDITERKQMEQQVRHLAFYDALTQLPNRRLLHDRLSRAMAASKRNNCYGAVMFLDLDNFKPINDTHGHGVGDALLIEAANRLKTCIRDIDTVARFGGDEFVVTLSDLNADEFEAASQAEIVAEKILSILSEPYRLSIRREGNPDDELIEHHCTVSIGVALFINHEASQDDLLKWADAAMYQAKVAGRNTIRFFDPAFPETEV